MIIMRLLASIVLTSALAIGCNSVDRDIRDFYEFTRLNTMSHSERLEAAEMRGWWTALAVGVIAFGAGAMAWRKK